MQTNPFKRLKMVLKPDDALSRQTPQFLSAADIHQWAQGHYPDEETTEGKSTAVDNHGQPLNRAYNRARLLDRAIDELLGLCKGVVADGVVNEREAQFLLDWMRTNREGANQWPANILYRRLAEMLADRRLDDREQDQLLALLYEITGSGKPCEAYVANFSTSLPLTLPAPVIHFPQRHFCLTGKFVSGTRQQCEGAIVAKGGTVQKVPTGETDYLVIGTVGSTDWIRSTHGRKIEAAVVLQERGHSIAIVSEKHWVTYLKAA